MLTFTLQDRLRRASALTGLEPAEMVRCAINEWLAQRLEQPPLLFASAASARAAQGGPGAGTDTSSGFGRRSAEEAGAPTPDLLAKREPSHDTHDA